MVALSGGPDSTALLLLLDGLAPEWGWRLTAAHFDHGVRPGGVARADCLRERLAGSRIELVTGRPERPLPPIHAALRRARYAWLEDVARREGADRIATGHQRDDQAETVLFRILRGTGNRGLAGIPARRGRLVRPLLGFGRAELAAWLEREGARPFDDPSNRDPRHARTRLRHRLLPALAEATGPGATHDLVAIAAAARDVQEALGPVARRALAAFGDGSAAAWPVELRAEALRLAARLEGVRLTGGAARRAATRMLELTSGHGLDLGGGLRLERDFDRWEVRRPPHPPGADRPIEIASGEPGSGAARLGGRQVRLRWGPPPSPRGAGGEAEKGPAATGGTRVALHVREDHYPLVVRARAPGDRIRLAVGRRKIGHVMAEARIPAHERPSVPVVVDRHGRILGMLAEGLGHRTDRDAAPTGPGGRGGATGSAQESDEGIIVIQIEAGDG